MDDDELLRIEDMPVCRFPVRGVGGGTVMVTTDGDYDGERFRSLAPYLMFSRAGYIQILNAAHLKERYLHHLVLPTKEGHWVVHKNGDKLDNRSANLQYMTPKEVIAIRERTMPQRPRVQGNGVLASPYRGVRPNGYGKGKSVVVTGMYTAIICQKPIGYNFRSAEEAARAYDREAIKRWGDLAVLNFPEEKEDR